MKDKPLISVTVVEDDSTEIWRIGLWYPWTFTRVLGERSYWASRQDPSDDGLLESSDL